MYDYNEHAVVSLDQSWTETFKTDMVEGGATTVAIDVRLAGVSSILQLKDQVTILVSRGYVCWEPG